MLLSIKGACPSLENLERDSIVELAVDHRTSYEDIRPAEAIVAQNRRGKHGEVGL